MSRIPVLSPEFSANGQSPRIPRSRLNHTSRSPATDRSNSNASPPSQKLVMPGARARDPRRPDEPKSDTAMMQIPRSRKDLSISPAATKSRIAKPVALNAKGQVASTSKSPVRVSGNSPREKVREMIDNSSSGVLYITEKLLFKITQVEYLHRVTELNLSLKGPKKIKFVEKLDDLYNLKKLNLSHNIIEKIAGLEKLNKLEVLDLSNNLITHIGDSLEHLGLLVELNLSGNKISGLPKFFGKNLASLRRVDLSANSIANVKTITALENLTNLTSLGLNGNPFCATSEFWEVFITYRIPTLASLDGREIFAEDHRQAHEQFGRMESQKLSDELQKTTNELRTEREVESQLRAQNDKLLAENKKLQEIKIESRKRLADLERDTENNNQLLAQKSREVNKLVDKNYELEQELAFFKIDKKFGNHGSFSDLTAPDNSDLSEDMPYVGKATAMTPQKRPKNLDLGGSEPENGLEILAGQNDSDEKNEPPSAVSKVKSQRPPAPHQVRFQEIEQNIQKSEQQLTCAEDRLNSTEKEIDDPQYFRNKKPPNFADKLSPTYLPGPKTGYQGFRENKGEIPWQAGELLKLSGSGQGSAPKKKPESPVSQNGGKDDAVRKKTVPLSPNSGTKEHHTKNKSSSKHGLPDQNLDKNTESEESSEPSINPKPILDEAIVKYRSLQSELDEMLKMVRSETATVMGLERTLNIEPPTDLIHNGVSGFLPPHVPVPVQPAHPLQMPNHPNVLGFEMPIGLEVVQDVQSGFQNQEQLMTRSLNSISNPIQANEPPKTTRPKNQSAEQAQLLKNELSNMAETVCGYMLRMRGEAQRLKIANKQLEGNIEEFSEREKVKNEQLAKLRDFFLRLEQFLLTMRNVFDDLHQLESKNKDLETLLQNYPDMEIMLQWKIDSDKLEAAKSMIRKLQQEQNSFQNQLEQQQLNEQKLKRDARLQNEKFAKLQSEMQHSHSQFRKLEETLKAKNDELLKLQEKFNEYVDVSIKSEDLLQHIQKLTHSALNFPQVDEVQMMHQNDLSGRALKDFQMILIGKFQEFDAKMLQAENAERDLNKKLSLEMKENENLANQIEQTKKEFAEKRESDKKEIELKIRQWKNEVKTLTDSLTNEKQKSQSQLDGFEAKRLKMREKIDILERELLMYDSEITQTHDTQKRDKNQFDRALESFQQNEIDLKSEIDSLKSEVKRLESSQVDQNREFDISKVELEREISSLKAAKAHLSESLQVVSNEKSAYKSKLSALKKEFSNLQIEFQETETSLETLTRDNQEMKLSNTLTLQNTEQIYETEIQNLSRIISTQEQQISTLNKDMELQKSLLAEKDSYLRSQQIHMQNSEEKLSREYLEEIDALKDRLKMKEKFLANSSKLVENIEDLDALIEEKESKLRAVEESLQKQNHKMQKVDRNWSEFKQMVTKHSEKSEVLDFLEGRTSNFVFFESVKSIFNELRDQKVEHEKLSRDIADKHSEYEYLRRKTEELMMEISTSQSKKEKTKEQIEVMKQLLEASQWQVREFSQMTNLYR